MTIYDNYVKKYKNLKKVNKALSNKGHNIF